MLLVLIYWKWRKNRYPWFCFFLVGFLKLFLKVENIWNRFLPHPIAYLQYFKHSLRFLLTPFSYVLQRAWTSRLRSSALCQESVFLSLSLSTFISLCIFSITCLKQNKTQNTKHTTTCDQDDSTSISKGILWPVSEITLL